MKHEKSATPPMDATTFRVNGLRQFEAARASIDPAFLPYLDRINALPWTVTSQCCTGHVSYTKNGKAGGTPFAKKHLPRRHSGRWGYLHLAVTHDVCQWMHEQAQSNGWDWIWVHGSQLFAVGAKAPCPVADDWIMIAFAWDAKHWPRAIEDIVRSLEQYAP